MLEDIVPGYILGVVLFLIVVLLFPQAWKESNSRWFTVLKFWFYIFPLMASAVGVMSFLIGPLYAIIGIFDRSYMLVTLLYIYSCFIIIAVDYINKKYNDILVTL